MRLIDQTKLPLTEEVVVCHSYADVAEAVRNMRIRGAPALGVAAAYALALAAVKSRARSVDKLIEEIDRAGRVIGETRPTAVNLFWGVERMRAEARAHPRVSVDQLKELLKKEALLIAAEVQASCRQMSVGGASLLETGDRVLTHCNSGPLAAVDYGTAGGALIAAHEQGKEIHVYVDETRPLLQGSRLTAWEMMRAGVPFTLITDNMAGWLMQQGKINKVMVGADRIAANGDFANKIGTYTIAVLAHHHQLPFYVVAPISTIDLGLASGGLIPIEERPPEEVTRLDSLQLAPEGVPVANPSFDVTPHRFVTAIVTERGVAEPPFDRSLEEMAS